MRVSRREALAVTGTALVAAGCGVPERLYGMVSRPPGPISFNDAPAARALGRAGFGHDPDSLALVAELGVQQWLLAQSDAPADEPAWLAQRISRLDIVNFSPWELRDWPEASVVGQLQQHSILRAVHTPWQLRERMVDFWSNHFSIYAKKGMGAYRKTLDDRTVVRPHVFGKFSDMLAASANSAAMLVYLDQQASTASHPNENYARELLELHTLGVDGGYTQDDVMEVARCFTGWTEERGFLKAKGRFRFDPTIHDDGAKRVLGHEIPAGGGVQDGKTVLSILARHPATARNVSRKLVRHFIGVGHPDAEEAVRQAFVRSGGQTRTMLRALFEREEFLAGTPVLKRPFDFAVSATRALGIKTDGGGEFQRRLAAMGQAPFQWPMPDGYPTEPEAWTGTLLARWNFADDLARGRIGGTPGPKLRGSVEDVVSAVLGAPADSAACQRVVACLRGVTDLADAAALALCSPEFQYR